MGSALWDQRMSGALSRLNVWRDGADSASAKPDCTSWPYWGRDSGGADCPHGLRIIDNEFDGAASAPVMTKLPRQFTCGRLLTSSAGLQRLFWFALSGSQYLLLCTAVSPIRWRALASTGRSVDFEKAWGF